MIVKLNKYSATERKRGLFYFYEDEFSFWPGRKEKVKFIRIKNDKTLNFLGTLVLRVRPMWEALRWHKKHKL